MLENVKKKLSVVHKALIRKLFGFVASLKTKRVVQAD